MTSKIDIHYCTGCRWLLRSAWMAQELLTTFDGEISELSLHRLPLASALRLDGAGAADNLRWRDQ